MSEKVIDISKKYSREISEISYILDNLEKGRYYENTGSKMDGYLSTNICNLRDELNELFNKIEYNKDSINEEMRKAFFKINE
ncbi:hypothetical protein [Clostridium pasteurianum]|uniref:Uncharacterized protein n=1 Tax=Clostridium pasteurianum BC1 TaxID=86416 RepID=R4K7C3_CLOPA|nr:hypothetical protein [Clostridium pasteurianum]AGK97601.1 hypothetical protein Clopa_2762 [Clostridium pasteurianum BC1]